MEKKLESCNKKGNQNEKNVLVGPHGLHADLVIGFVSDSP